MAWSVLTGHRRAINAATGPILVGISLYYLFFVFEIARILLDAQNLRDFFLRLDDDLSFSQSDFEALVFPLQEGDALDSRIFWLCFAPPLFGVEPLQNAFIALPAPGAQVRGIQPLSAQQGSNFAGMQALFGLVQHAQLIGGGEFSTYFFLWHFRIR